MYNTTRIILKKYSLATTVRAAVMLIPLFGKTLDFWLIEKLNYTEKEYNKKLLRGVAKTIDLLNRNKLIYKHMNIKTYPRTIGPEFVFEGKYILSECVKRLSQEHATTLKSANQPNDQCAIVVEEPRWTDNPAVIVYRDASYSDVLAIRHTGMQAKMASVNGVVFCEESRCLILHRRSARSQDFPHTLHTFGGAFMPPTIDGRGDIVEITECFEREFHEESGISTYVPKGTIRICIDEHSIQFIQTVLLGISVSSAQLEKMRHNWEGKVVILDFDELQTRMLNLKEWTLSGWVHILLWLALDAPGMKSRPRFEKLTPHQLQDLLIRELANLS